MLFISVSLLIIAIFTYLMYAVMSGSILYHAVKVSNNPKLINNHIVSNLPNKSLNMVSSTNSLSSVLSFYKDNYEQAFINACENVRWLSIQNNCSNPNDYYNSWTFLPSTAGYINSITGVQTAFNCSSRSQFGEYVFYNAISKITSNTCVACYYNLNPNTISSNLPYAQSLPYKSGAYGQNITHSIISMGDPCAVGSFVSCTYICK